MNAAEWNSELNRNDSVGDIVWELGNILWRQYAQRRLHQQATELAKTFGALQPSESTRLEGRGFMLAQSTLAQSYYWRGRLGVVLLDFRQSRDWLERAWKACPEDGWQQRRWVARHMMKLTRQRDPHQTYSRRAPAWKTPHAGGAARLRPRRAVRAPHRRL